MAGTAICSYMAIAVHFNFRVMRIIHHGLQTKKMICIIYPYLTDTDTKRVALHSETASAVMFQYISKHHTPIINHHPIINYHHHPNKRVSIYHASFLCLSFINVNLISTFVYLTKIIYIYNK